MMLYILFNRFFLQKRYSRDVGFFRMLLSSTSVPLGAIFASGFWNDLFFFVSCAMIWYHIKGGGKETKEVHLTVSLIGSVSDGLRRKLGYMYLMENRRVFMFWTYVSYKI